MARPRIIDRTAKVRHVAVRLGIAEHGAVLERASAEGLSLSNFIRARLDVGSPASELPQATAPSCSQADRTALYSLGKRLHQGVLALELAHDEEGAAQVKVAAAKLEAVLDRLLGVRGKAPGRKAAARV